MRKWKHIYLSFLAMAVVVASIVIFAMYVGACISPATYNEQLPSNFVAIGLVIATLMLAFFSLKQAESAEKVASKSLDQNRLLVHIGLREQIEKYLPWIEVEFRDYELAEQIEVGPKLVWRQGGSARILQYSINKIDLKEQAYGEFVAKTRSLRDLKKLSEVYSNHEELRRRVIESIKSPKNDEKPDDYVDLVYVDEISSIELKRRLFIDYDPGTQRIKAKPRASSKPPVFHGFHKDLP